ncbi:MAG: hypothetical protein ABSE82_02220 [Nitrososphaerales archaeon]|jgi:hypothetical protein
MNYANIVKPKNFSIRDPLLWDTMSTDEKIRLGMLALSVVSAVVVAAHFGHLNVRPPLLDEIGGIGSF